MTVESGIKVLKKQIDRRIEQFFARKLSEAGSDKILINMVTEASKFVKNGGKRLRPLLVIFGFRATGGRQISKILNAAAAMELIHNGLLIQDDIIDQDVIRRGKDTVHLVYQKQYKFLRNEKASHAGVSAAIIIGDLLINYGYELLGTAIADTDYKLNALECLTATLNQVYYGQMLDVFSHFENRISLDQLTKINELKTEVYSFAGPLEIGALLAGGDKKTITLLRQYAKPIGLAFQVKDDLLGLFGDAKKIGKNPGRDIEQGKFVYPVLVALSVYDNKKRQQVIKKIRSLDQKERLAFVRQIIRSTGALDTCNNLIISGSQKARLIAQKSPFSKETKDFFIYFADYLAKREL